MSEDRNPITGEEVLWLVNPGGAIVSVNASHPAAVVLRGGGDIGDRKTFAGFRLATPAEVRVGRKREGLA